MAVADTYNGDLVRIRLMCPEEGSNLTASLTDFLEQAYAYINLRLAEMGATVPEASPDNALKMIEAMIGGGLFKESQIFPEDDKDFGRTSNLRKTGEAWLERWLEQKYGESSDDADDFCIHQKVSRPAHIAASEFDDDRDVI